MKRCILLTILIMGLCLTNAQALPKLLIGASNFATTGVLERPSVLAVRGGLSTHLGSMYGGELYGIVLGKIGERGDVWIRGADMEIAFFPKGTEGTKLFFLSGLNISQIEEAGEDFRVTYLQAANGFGIHHQLTSDIAIWSAMKLETSEELTTVYWGAGLSLAIF